MKALAGMVISAALAAAPLFALDARAEFSGRWKLNEKQSQLPAPPQGGDGPMMRGGQGGGGGHRGGGGRGGGGRGGRGAQMREMTIAQSRERLVITGADKSERTIDFGDQATWTKSDLVVKRQTPRGTVNETWSLSPEGQLVISAETPRGEIRLVYDKQK